jgi:hypothetical protein
MSEVNNKINKYKWAAERIKNHYILSCSQCEPSMNAECSKYEQDECEKDMEALKIAIRILEVAAMYTSKEPENLKDALDRGELSLNE